MSLVCNKNLIGSWLFARKVTGASWYVRVFLKESKAYGVQAVCHLFACKSVTALGLPPV